MQLFAAGYKSTTVPTNVYLRSMSGRVVPASSVDGAGNYDLDSESGTRRWWWFMRLGRRLLIQRHNEEDDLNYVTNRRVSMGLSVWRETSKKLTVCREKGKKLTVCRELFLFRLACCL